MRERMRKLTAAILMLVMVSVMFTACGSNSSDKSDNATQESTSEYVSEDIKVAALKGPVTALPSASVTDIVPSVFLVIEAVLP